MISAYVDRFEGALAVLLVGEDEKKVNFPKKYLPDDVGEGDYIKLAIERDAERTAEAEAEALALLEDS